MIDNFPRVKVAVVQAAPTLFDREATVEKACRLTAEAAAQGAKLILFPEAFIPAYPRGLSFGAVVGSRSSAGRLTWQRYWANAVDVPGPVTEELGRASRQAGAYLAVGVIERDRQQGHGEGEGSSQPARAHCRLPLTRHSLTTLPPSKSPSTAPPPAFPPPRSLQAAPR
jgi:predicted amidohydrolase